MMIERIADGMWMQPIQARGVEDETRRRQRRRRPVVLARPGVEIAQDTVEMAAIGAFRPAYDLSARDDDEADDLAVAVSELAGRLMSFPLSALAAQARLGSAAVQRLIAVNGMNPV